MADTPALVFDPSTALEIGEPYVNPNPLSTFTIGNSFSDPILGLGTTYIGGSSGNMTPAKAIHSLDMTTGSYYVGNPRGIFTPSSPLYVRGLDNFQTGDDSIELILGLEQDFDATPKEGSVPLSVTFSDLSSPYVTAWFWEFGDGGTSTLQNPTHTYIHAGVYTVRQTISIGIYNFSLEKQLYITAHPMPGPTGDMTAVDGSNLCPGTSIAYKAYFLSKTGPFYQEGPLDATSLKIEVSRGYVSYNGSYESQNLNPVEISYAIKKIDSTADATGHLVGYEYRTPMNPDVGVYYSNMDTPGQVGRYKIEWFLRRDNTQCPEKRIQEFDIYSLGIDATYAFPT